MPSTSTAPVPSTSLQTEADMVFYFSIKLFTTLFFLCNSLRKTYFVNYLSDSRKYVLLKENNPLKRFKKVNGIYNSNLYI